MHSTVHRAPRYQVVVPAVFTAELAEPCAGSGWTRDLSETGACLELREPLRPGTRLTVVLELSTACAAVDARVVWSRRGEAEGAPALHGIAFALAAGDLPPALATLLERLRHQRTAAARLPATLPARCIRLDGPDTALQGWTSDIGHGGCCLLLSERLPVGTAIEITLATPRGDVAARGTVLWCAAPSGGRELCAHGIGFAHSAVGKDLLLGLVLEDVSGRPAAGRPVPAPPSA